MKTSTTLGLSGLFDLAIGVALIAIPGMPARLNLDASVVKLIHFSFVIAGLASLVAAWWMARKGR